MNGLHKPKRACIIGAGAAGLCAIRQCLAHNLEPVCFEKATELGGTWVYSENIDLESAEAQNSLYDGLCTNLPKEVMGFPDYPYPSSMKDSYISAAKVLEYLQAYAEHFMLNDCIEYQQEVIRVRPYKGKWEVSAVI